MDNKEKKRTGQAVREKAGQAAAALRRVLRQEGAVLTTCLGGLITCLGLSLWSVPLGVTVLGLGIIGLGLLMAKGGGGA